jgi:hypothetical protein
MVVALVAINDTVGAFFKNPKSVGAFQQTH